MSDVVLAVKLSEENVVKLETTGKEAKGEMQTGAMMIDDACLLSLLLF